MNKRKRERFVTYSSSSDPGWWLLPKYNPGPFISSLKTAIACPFPPHSATAGHPSAPHFYECPSRLRACLPSCIYAHRPSLPETPLISLSRPSFSPQPKGLIIREGLLDFFPAECPQLCRSGYTRLSICLNRLIVPSSKPYRPHRTGVWEYTSIENISGHGIGFKGKCCLLKCQGLCSHTRPQCTMCIFVVGGSVGGTDFFFQVEKLLYSALYIVDSECFFE